MTFPPAERDVATDADSARLTLLASAIAGRPLRVAEQAPGEPAWTDGTTLYLDSAATPRLRLESVAVQAALLAAGGLDAGIMRRLGRRRAVVSRYLAVEGHRALLAAEAILPPAVTALTDRVLAASVDSPEAALLLARGRAPIDPAPDSFGAIRPRALRDAAGSEPRSAARNGHTPRRNRRTGESDALDEQAGEEMPDPFSSPIGGGGALGELLRRLLGAARRGGGNGRPGADSITHRARDGTGGSGTVVSAAADRAEYDGDEPAIGFTYPEWDTHRRGYRPAWCIVHEVEPAVADGDPAPHEDGHRLRAALARLAVGLDRHRRQPQGDDLDVDAVVGVRVDAIAGTTPGEFVYCDTLRRRRDLSVLVLLDISGSVAEQGVDGRTVHEQQRVVAAALVTALHGLGDRVALYAFRSAGRQAVQVLPVKRFHEPLGVTTRRRLAGLEPGSYSRLGAAVRHSTEVLRSRGGTPRRLLVVLSDGLAYDHGYERAYGAADARRALAEARQAGIGAVCVTVGARTGDDELARVFGTAAHAGVRDPSQVGRIIGPLFRTALRHTHGQRRRQR